MINRVSSADLPPRSEQTLRSRQERGELRVRTAAAYRQLVRQAGLAEAYAVTDVVVAAEALFTEQASLLLSLGPTDPPIRLWELQLGGVGALGGCGPTDLVVPMGGGGARVLEALLAGESVALAASGEATPSTLAASCTARSTCSRSARAACCCSGQSRKTASWP